MIVEFGGSLYELNDAALNMPLMTLRDPYTPPKDFALQYATKALYGVMTLNPYAIIGIHDTDEAEIRDACKRASEKLAPFHKKMMRMVRGHHLPKRLRNSETKGGGG